MTKESWPELLGTPAKFAKQIIQKENPKLTNVETLLNGSAFTEDLRCNRVRLFVNLLDIVVQTPKVGWTKLIDVISYVSSLHKNKLEMYG